MIYLLIFTLVMSSIAIMWMEVHKKNIGNLKGVTFVFISMWFVALATIALIIEKLS